MQDESAAYTQAAPKLNRETPLGRASIDKIIAHDVCTRSVSLEAEQERCMDLTGATEAKVNKLLP